MNGEQEQPKRLYKSRRLRMIDGVCGGIAEYFGVDVTIIRLLFVLLGLMGGTGLLVYIAAMIIMPSNPEFSIAPGPQTQQGNGRRFWGIVLILIGATILFVNLGWLTGYPWWSFSGTVVLPVLMIGVGLFIIFSLRSRQQKEGEAAQSSTSTGEFTMAQEQVRELRRSIRNRKLFGVCGGLGDYFSVDPTIVRLVFVALVFASFGWALLIYIALGILMPEEKLSIQP
jgi:phage shock protein PspC (stress-responsive transcriptional regulator)